MAFVFPETARDVEQSRDSVLPLLDIYPPQVAAFHNYIPRHACFALCAVYCCGGAPAGTMTTTTFAPVLVWAARV